MNEPEVTREAPRWVRDAVFYQIFPDRFAFSTTVPKPSHLEPWDSPPTIYGFKGGDLIGIVERLDYLQNLGVTALYLCPIFQSAANHRYHTYDYYEVDPILGGNDALCRLLDAAHARSMRVVLDGVFNHCGRGFFQFNHILENGGDSPYLDWFTVYRWPLAPYGPADTEPGYWAWWGDRALPKFNTSTESVREFLWGVGEYWAKRGIDGWRLDVPNEIDDDEFWREFRRRVKRANPEAYIVGEIWGDAGRWLQGDQFDAVMNYPFTKAALGFFGALPGINTAAVKGTGLDPVVPLSAEEFGRSLEQLVTHYPETNAFAQFNLLDSHDTARFLTLSSNDESALRMAMVLQYTFVGTPCTYYGDEIGMASKTTVEDARASFNWNPSSWNGELLDHVRACIGLRHRYEVFRSGTFSVLFAGQDICVFRRTLGDTVAIVAFNSADSAHTIDIPLPEGREASTFHPVWGMESLTSNTVGGATWQLPARCASIVISEVVPRP